MADASMQQKFLANNGEKPRRAREKPAAKKRRTPIKAASENAGLTKIILAAYRDAYIHLARRYDDLRCWECGLECKPSELDLHHIKRRSQGGLHKAFNLRLVCNRKSPNGLANCHDRLDNNDVRWSKGEGNLDAAS